MPSLQDMTGPIVAVKHVGGYDDPNKGHTLSFLSLEQPNSIANEDFHLPFDKDKSVDGMGCRGLFYYYDTEGNSVICNLTTREIKHLSLPSGLLPAPNLAIFNGCGFGYDAASDDFKVIRNYGQTFAEEDECGEERYLGSEMYTQLYSLNSDSWKNIPNVDAIMHGGNAVYIEETGFCYWLASLYDPNDGVGCVAFNLAREEFSIFCLPRVNTQDYTYTLVKRFNHLGVITTPRPFGSRAGYSSFSPMITTYGRVGEDWIKYHKVFIPHNNIQRTLSLINDRFMVVESKRSWGDGVLLLYDLNAITKRWTEISIFSALRQLNVFLYEESTRRLTDASELYKKWMLVKPVLLERNRWNAIEHSTSREEEEEDEED